MLRDLANFREAQGNNSAAELLRAMAIGLVNDTMDVSFSPQSKTGHAWFNVIFPSTSSKVSAAYTQPWCSAAIIFLLLHQKR